MARVVILGLLARTRTEHLQDALMRPKQFYQKVADVGAILLFGSSLERVGPRIVGYNNRGWE
jgi:hypothetical protein